MTNADLIQRVKDSMDAESLIDVLSTIYPFETIVDALTDIIVDASDDFHNLTQGEY